jgi:thiol-disulfide isomerase/thioredoxin
MTARQAVPPARRRIELGEFGKEQRMMRTLRPSMAADDTALADDVDADAARVGAGPDGGRTPEALPLAVGADSARRNAARRRDVPVLVRGAIFLTLLALPGPAQAGDVTITLGAPAPSAADGWEESLGLEAVVSDSVDVLARIFDSPDYQRQLLLPGSGDQAFLLGLKDQVVKVLPRAAVTWTAEEQAVLDVAQGKDGGKLAKLAGEVTFDAGGANWAIRPAPPLVGAITLEALRKAKPDYVRLAGKYKPDPGAVKSIASARDARIVIFFGSWCHLCKKAVPQLLQTVEAAKNPGLALEFYGVTEDHQEPKDSIAKYSISTTPTFIIIRGGKEVGRITEEPDVSVEKDLALILAAK